MKRQWSRINPEHGSVLHAVNATLYTGNPEYAWAVLKSGGIERLPLRARCQSYIDIGLILYDLGCRDDGVELVEKGIALARACADCTPGTATNALYLLICRLNDQKYWGRRLDYADQMTAAHPENDTAHLLLAKAYIDSGRHDDAKRLLDDLISCKPYCRVYLADLYFAMSDYGAAAALYDEYALPDYADWWHAQFDYKKAAAYYHTGQTEKWKKQAKEIGHRVAWDRFYRVDCLEAEGVERISEIDAEIAKWTYERRFDPVRMRRIATRLPHTLWCTACVYRYPVLYFVAGTLFLGALLCRLILEICRAL